MKKGLTVEQGGVSVHYDGLGIRPILTALDAAGFCGCAVSDNVVGAAAAYLFVYGGAASVHAGVLSKAAEEVLERYGVPFRADVRTPRIRSRDGKGFCPMEARAATVHTPEEAYALFKGLSV